MADASKTHKLPPGYENEEDFVKEARERFQRGVDFDQDNRNQGLEDLKFLSGEQWDLEAKTLRAGRPMLTINTLPQHVAQVIGDLRINPPAIRVRPAKDATKDLADTREGLIRAIERDNDAQGVYILTGTSQVGCGIGNFRISLKYETEDGFDMDIAIEQIPDAFAVVWDPQATERTGKDASWCFVQDMLPRKAYEKRYGTTIASGLEVPLHDTNGWFTQDTVRVTEYWIMKETPVELALLEGGQVVEADKAPKGAKVLKKRKATRRTACVYLIDGTRILDGPIELAIDRVPIIRAQGWEITVGTRRVRWGLVRFARDPSRLRNYWRSISAEMLALAPKGKWLVHEAQEGEQDAFREALSNDDPSLVWSGQVKPEYIAPPTLNVAVLQESALNAQDIKDTTGQHDASLGAKSNETSGKAIMARQREGDVATYIYVDNLHAAIEEGGRVINQLIPVVYDTAREIRVLGEDASVKIARINDPNDPASIDINQGRYDIAVESGPSYSTKRVEAADSMMQFVQAVPAAAQVAGDLIAQAQDWPLADKIGERLKAMLPPQITMAANQDATPEEQQRAQQAAQQAQQQGELQAQHAQLSLAEMDAKVKKVQAEAAKINAEANAAGQPEQNPAMAALDMQLKVAQVRKENALADEAEANARLADYKAGSAAIDLTAKPLEVAHSAVDLNTKMNPPDPAEEAQAEPAQA